MENLDYDGLRLLKIILKDTFEPFILLHLIQNNEEKFIFTRNPEIRTCYGFVVERTPEYLEKKKILKILETYYFSIDNYNRLTSENWEKSFFKSTSERLSKDYKNFTKHEYDFSKFGFYSATKKKIPASAIRGLCYVVINRKKAISWIKANEQKEISNITAPSERPYWYENKVLYFRLSDGSTEPVDFTKAEKSRQIFETFWELWKKDSKGEYSRKQVVDMYQKHNQTSYDTGKIGEDVSNAKTSLIKPKATILERIVWEFNRQSNSWSFKLS